MDWLSLALCLVPIAFFLCCCGGCTHCDNDEAEEYELVVAGFSNKFPVDCSDCANINGTYTLARDDDPGWCLDDNCCYSYYFSSVDCDAYRIRMQIRSGDIAIDVESDPSGGSPWRHQFVGAKSSTCVFTSQLCTAFSSFGTPVCSVAGATIEVTSL